MRDFKKYSVWEQSHKLVLDVYKVSNFYPPEEKFGLQSQIRRASVSIPTNIAEGFGKISEKDFARFLNISFGSAAEVEYLNLLAFDLKFVPKEAFDKIEKEIISIKKQLYQLIKKLNA